MKDRLFDAGAGGDCQIVAKCNNDPPSEWWCWISQH